MRRVVMNEISDVCHSHSQELIIGVVVFHGEGPALVSRLRLVNLASAFKRLAVYCEFAMPHGTLRCIGLADQASGFD